MAEAPSLPAIEEEKIDEEFYEKIEAPKFVDFTAPEIRRSHEDRYWFCSRVGCDQNHEEELDSEAIYKNFVLRVMAARSPNVRLRKALNKREATANLKCPLTAPAKSSKTRVSRLALISSFSKKIGDYDKARTRPLSKVNATPKNSKVKQSSATAKAFTTPRKQKKSLNIDQFRTVQGKKEALNVAVPKNRVIAKTLVFHSPKKAVKIKRSVELKKTPMKSLCSAMKKLEIDSVKKKNEEASRKKFKGREVKSRVFDSLYPNRCLKGEKKLKSASQIHEGSIVDHGDSSDMEIDEKSRDGSLERCHKSSTSSEEAEEKKSSEDYCTENEEKREKIPEAAKRNDNKENSLASDDDKRNDNKENSLASDDDNKENVLELNENASAPDENRTIVVNHNNLEKPKNDELRKKQKKPTSNATTGSKVVKYRKLRPTNPKPFKLRTDERGILKEANLEKKPLSPLKETTAKGGKTMRKRVIQRNEQDSDNNSCEDRTNHATEGDKSVSIQCSVLGNSNMEVNRLYATPQRRDGPKFQKPIDTAERPKQREKAAQKLDDNFKRTSHMTQPKLVRPRSALSRKKENGLFVTPGKQHLSAIDENSSNPKPKEAAKAGNNSDSSRSKVCSANSSSRSRPRKTILTVPKEPNFQSLHVPKSCTKKMT
ncbi:uncharacterized protein LOC129294935 isoform X2 [Prosopis cineraria]|uniref:uncharacterized protein LOC129294935 isoform X2 n=1 Tax=Prosopis cineraria TaxID=364024 RepID=UPI0024109C69|nr:uncharacterized protein LOC129294935 isoform X2 [Prosopis cineraria]